MSNILVQLIREKIDINGVNEWCTDPKAGAVTIFVGTTRDNFEDENGLKEVTELSYEADEELALVELHDICEEALTKYDGLKACIIHRLDTVSVGEVSIVCSISTPHRKEGFEACECMMKDLKKRVPIFKKEVYKQGESVWKENVEYFEK